MRPSQVLKARACRSLRMRELSWLEHHCLLPHVCRCQSEPLLPLRPNHKGEGLCVQSRAQAYQQREVQNFWRGDCDLLPPPLVLNLGHRKERSALSGAIFPPALAFCPWAFPTGVRHARGVCYRELFPCILDLLLFFPLHNDFSSSAQPCLGCSHACPPWLSFPGAPSSPGSQS